MNRPHGRGPEPDVNAVVVGAGVSGAFATHTLRRRFGAVLKADVFERAERTGGRVWRRPVLGAEVETGASLFHSANRLIAGAAQDLGLGVVGAGGQGTLGIWDGTRLVFRTTGRVDGLRLLARYRLALVRGSREVGRLVRRLDQVYTRLEAGESWDTPELLWRSIGLDRLGRRRAEELIAAGRFRTEFVDGVSRNNYAQDATGLNALSELVSLAGAGLGGGSLHRIAEGNAAVSAGLLERSEATLHLAATVERIEPSGAAWRVTGSGFTPLDADVVVLATPLEGSGIELVDVPVPAPRTFVTLHVTFVTGGLRPEAIGARGATPDIVLTTAEAGSVMSIERVASTGGSGLYKVFSTEELTDDVVSRFFVASGVTRMTWSSYPYLAPAGARPGFRLAPGLYYTGAMEYAVSTMETQAIAGVATANLAFRDRT